MMLAKRHISSESPIGGTAYNVKVLSGSEHDMTCSQLKKARVKQSRSG